MSTNRIDSVFERLGQGGQRALLPYLTAGYPDLPTTGRLIKGLDALGVAGIELGFPFSDSIADGPVIQGSFHRALGRGLRIGQIFELVETIRHDVSTALMAMVSFSIVRRIGTEVFTRRARDAGFDGLIVPDLPIEEVDELAPAVERSGLKLIMLTAPTSPPERRLRIAQASTGFVYQMAVAGITGERAALPAGLIDTVRQLREASGQPVCVGFGIGNAEQVRRVAEVADGVIVGSAIVRRITDLIDADASSDEIVTTVTDFVADLMRGTE